MTIKEYLTRRRQATEPGAYSLAILSGLQRGRHIYAGTVDDQVVADRRRKNKAARASRRINRRTR